MKTIENIIKSLPTGFFKVSYNNSCYGVTKTTYNNGKSFKIFAEELKGTDSVSLNFYCTANHKYLKPCEMPAQKVKDFLKKLKIENK